VVVPPSDLYSVERGINALEIPDIACDDAITMCVSAKDDGCVDDIACVGNTTECPACSRLKLVERHDRDFRKCHEPG